MKKTHRLTLMMALALLVSGRLWGNRVYQPVLLPNRVQTMES
jgi:endo-1,4-beta-D-glucanase Y